MRAKDCSIDKRAASRYGVLDIKSYGDIKNRGWVLPTVGYAHGDEFCKPIISMLRMYDYDDVLSIEHEDSLMGMGEGCRLLAHGRVAIPDVQVRPRGVPVGRVLLDELLEDAAG